MWDGPPKEGPCYFLLCGTLAARQKHIEAGVQEGSDARHSHTWYPEAGRLLSVCWPLARVAAEVSGDAQHYFSWVQEQADRKAQELAQVKAAYEETKARLRKAEEKVRLIMERCAFSML